MKCIRTWLVPAALFGLWLCGLTFDQLRLFDMRNIPCAYDGRNYLAMSYGKLDVPRVHRYRVVIPGAVGVLRSFVPLDESSRPNVDKVLFYLVNLVLGSLLLTVSFRFLVENGISLIVSFATTVMLGGTRFILQAISQQLIDTGLYLAIAALVYFLSTNRWKTLSLWMPLMALSKEPIYPLLLIPAVLAPRGKRLVLAGGYLAAVLAVAVVRYWVDTAPAVGPAVAGAPWKYANAIHPDPPDPGWGASHENGLVDTIRRHLVVGAKSNLKFLCSPRGVFDVFLAFSLLWPLMFYGMRHAPMKSRWWLWLFLPYALACGLLSRHWGRQLVIAFPLVIYYAGVGLERLGRKIDPLSPNSVQKDNPV